MNILLCGLPGVGKSYYGKKIAEQLVIPFFDTDVIIASNYGTPCREIYYQHGERYFRKLEHEALASLAHTDHAIVALGGGSLCFEENIPLIKKLGKLIYLRTPPEIVISRLLKKEPLPSYIDPDNIVGSFMSLRDCRLPLFERYCDLAVDAELADVAEKIIKYRETIYGQ